MYTINIHEGTCFHFLTCSLVISVLLLQLHLWFPSTPHTPFLFSNLWEIKVYAKRSTKFKSNFHTLCQSIWKQFPSNYRVQVSPLQQTFCNQCFTRLLKVLWLYWHDIVATMLWVCLPFSLKSWKISEYFKKKYNCPQQISHLILPLDSLKVCCSFTADTFLLFPTRACLNSHTKQNIPSQGDKFNSNFFINLTERVKSNRWGLNLIGLNSTLIQKLVLLGIQWSSKNNLHCKILLLN